MYRFTPSFQAGVEYNPLDDDVGLLANWRLVDETRRRPALIVGTSSDRIGTTEGRAIYATLSKSLEPLLDLPVAPYAGASFSGQDDELDFIGGASVFWTERFTTTHFYDGDNVHHLAGTRLGDRHNVGALLVQQDDEYHLGVTYTIEL